MTDRDPARRAHREVRVRTLRVASLLVVGAGIAAGLGYGSLASPSSTTHPPAGGLRGEREGASGTHRDRPVALGQAGGDMPGGVSVFDDAVAGVAKLDPALLGAVRRAATDAARDGVTFVVEGGWRSPAYQRHLLREAVRKYGSRAEAGRWVATPETSAHVSGDAIDIGPTRAAAWLSAHGARYGLCQIYRNEPWHYELHPQAVDGGCPPMYADPSQDPRMQG